MGLGGPSQGFLTCDRFDGAAGLKQTAILVDGSEVGLDFDDRGSSHASGVRSLPVPVGKGWGRLAMNVPSTPVAATVIEDRMLRSLVKLAAMVTRGTSAGELIESVANTALEALGAASLSLCEMTDGGQVINVVINVGDLAPHEEPWPTDETYRVEDYATSLQFLRDPTAGAQLVRADDPQAELSEVALLQELGKYSSLNAPILVEGSLWGSLFATRSHGQPAFDERDAAVADVIAALVSAGLAQARAWQAMRALAETDSLTGLANRRRVQEHAEQWVDEVSRRGGRVAVVLADVNDLKLINDTEGHAAGDHALQHVAATAREALADVPAALAGRLGGDEFVMILPNVSRATAEAIAEQWCRTALAGDTSVSLACGVAIAEGRAATSVHQLIEAADLAQYQAKRERLARPVVRELVAQGSH